MASVTFVDAPFWDTEYLMEQAWQPSPSTFLDGFAGENDIQIIEGLGSKDSGGGGGGSGSGWTPDHTSSAIDTARSVWEAERAAKAARDAARADSAAEQARREHELRMEQLRADREREQRERERERRDAAGGGGGGEEEGLSTTAMVGIGVGVVVLGLGVVMLMRR